MRISLNTLPTQKGTSFVTEGRWIQLARHLIFSRKQRNSVKRIHRFQRTEFSTLFQLWRLRPSSLWHFSKEMIKSFCKLEHFHERRSPGGQMDSGQTFSELYLFLQGHLKPIYMYICIYLSTEIHMRRYICFFSGGRNGGCMSSSELTWFIFFNYTFRLLWGSGTTGPNAPTLRRVSMCYLLGHAILHECNLISLHFGHKSSFHCCGSATKMCVARREFFTGPCFVASPSPQPPGCLLCHERCMIFTCHEVDSSYTCPVGL